jgi:MtrB/PioB family decaheme-associated outer membrane protein
MKKHQYNRLALRASVLAVSGALSTLALFSGAYAADESTAYTNSMEAGGIFTDKGSAKFGEYNGLDQKGGSLDLGFDVRGGSAYDSDENSRFRIRGTNLGLTTRNLGAEFGQQGKFRISLGYDELQKNRSDSYQTPYMGVGSSNLTLNKTSWAPGVLPVSYFGGSVKSDSSAMTAAQQSDFHNVDLNTNRKKLDAKLGFAINSQWSIDASARRETKVGTQAQGAALTVTAGQITLPIPISYATDTYNMALSFAGEKSHFKAAVNVSNFNNANQSVSFDNPFGFFGQTINAASNTSVVTSVPNNFGRLGLAPSNQYQQLSLSGDYKFSPTLKLVGDVSYAKSKQAEALLPVTTFGDIAPYSNDRTVLNKAAFVKLAWRPWTKLNLTGSYKYDERENNSAANLYNVAPTDNGGSGRNLTMWNVPISRTLNHYILDADYAVAKNQWIKGGFEREDIQRSCGTLPGSAYSTGGNTPATTGTNCVNVSKNTEDTWRLEYRNNIWERWSGRVGYSYSDRENSSYNWLTINRMSAGSATLPQVRYDVGQRHRDKFRSALSWQATDSLALTGTVDYNNDRYQNSPFGLQRSEGWIFGLDGSYSFSDTLAINAYATREDKRLTMLEGSTIANMWQADHRDDIDSLGLGVKKKGLMGGKLEIGADLLYTRANSPVGINANQANTGTGAYSPLPDILSQSDQIKLNAKYTVDKNSAVRFTYATMHLTSTNYAWDGLQTGSHTGYSAASATNGCAVGNAGCGAGYYNILLPTNEKAPNYRVNVVSVTYLYSFK